MCGFSQNHHEVVPGVYGFKEETQGDSHVCRGSRPGVYGSGRRHMATPKANMLPIVYCTTCINVFAITRSIMEARTQGRRDMRGRGRFRGRVWALGGPYLKPKLRG